MNPALTGIWEHMRELGLGALAHANRHSAYAAMENPAWYELSVVQAAHAAELLVKARIAQEHPLLIFEKLPRSTQPPGSMLDLEDLFRQGKTLQWADLPSRLWATTGIEIPERQQFEQFGKLRNTIQHFTAPPERDFSLETLRFVFSVIDPFINQCWGLYAIDYDEDYDPYVYLIGALANREIPFLVSPGAAECYENWAVDWAKVSPEYKQTIQARVAVSKKTEAG